MANLDLPAYEYLYLKLTASIYKVSLVLIE